MNGSSSSSRALPYVFRRGWFLRLFPSFRRGRSPRAARHVVQARLRLRFQLYAIRFSAKFTSSRSRPR